METRRKGLLSYIFTGDKKDDEIIDKNKVI
jgi:hypothetical protein